MIRGAKRKNDSDNGEISEQRVEISDDSSQRARRGSRKIWRVSSWREIE